MEDHGVKVSVRSVGNAVEIAKRMRMVDLIKKFISFFFNAEMLKEKSKTTP